jgi:hypothetical protein
MKARRCSLAWGMLAALFAGSALAAEYLVNPRPYPGSREHVETFPLREDGEWRVTVGFRTRMATDDASLN